MCFTFETWERNRGCFNFCWHRCPNKKVKAGYGKCILAACRGARESFARKEGKNGVYPYYNKTIINVGEIYFDTKNYEANTFGINLAFKIEKKFGKNEIEITDVVRQIILQEINAGKFKINTVGECSIYENENVLIPVWKLELNK